jgi:hypothetical protein
MEIYATSCAVTVSISFLARVLKAGKIMYHNLFHITLLTATIAMTPDACAAASVPKQTLGWFNRVKLLYIDEGYVREDVNRKMYCLISMPEE